MDWEEDIKEKLGAVNVEIVKREIRNGKINNDKLKELANCMHKEVYGDFIHNERQGHNLVYLFRKMLDCWYNKSLCVKSKSNEDAQTEFRSLLQEVELNAIAQKITISQSVQSER